MGTGRTKNHPFLYRRGNVWWIVVKVPTKIKHLYSSPHVRRSTRTDSLKEAELERDLRVPQIKLDFRHKLRAAAGSLPEDTREALAYRADLQKLREAGDHDTAEAVEGIVTDRAYAIEAKAGVERAKAFASIAFDEKGRTLREAFAEWIEVEGFRGGTNAKYRRALDEVLAFLGVPDAVPSAITTERVRAYVDHLNTRAATPKGAPLDPATRQARVNAMSGFWKWLEGADLVPHDAHRMWSGHTFTGAREKRRRKAKERPYLPEEIIALCNGPERREHSRYTKRTVIELTALGLLTGARLEELCARTLSEVERIKGGAYRLHITDAKSAASNRSIPVRHPIAVAILKRRIGKRSDPSAYLFAEFIPGGPDNKRSWQVQKAHGRYRQELGMPEGVNFHSTRRSFATRLEELGVDERWAQRYFGHKPPGLMAGLYSRPQVLDDVAKKIKYPAHVERALRAALGIA